MKEGIFLNDFLTRSKRNKEMICHEGQAYNLKQERNNKKIWRCVNRNCPGSLHTDCLYKLLKYNKHTHEPIRDILAGKELLANMKKKAVETTETPRNILYQEVIKYPELFIQNKHGFKYIKDSITRIRRETNLTLNEVTDVPVELHFLSSGERFYIFDSGVDEENRIIVFTTIENVLNLSSQKEWFIDATFKTVPKNFEQLLVIQANVYGKKFSLFFCLMKHKNEASYNKAFEILNRYIENLNLNWIILDYELALYNSLNKNFPGVKLRGCWFHFNQIFQRKLCELGFRKIFKAQPEFRNHCKLILSLAAVPVSDIKIEVSNLKFYFENKRNLKGEIKIVFDWFVLNFVNNEKLANHYVEFWSIYDRIVSDISLTTNSLEAYNRHLNSVAETRQPSLYSLGSELKKETELNQVEIIKLQNNLNASISKKSTNSPASDYGKVFGVNFLRRFAYSHKFCFDI